VIDERTDRLLALAVVVVTVTAGMGGSYATLALLSDEETVGVTFSAATDYDAAGNAGNVGGDTPVPTGGNAPVSAGGNTSGGGNSPTPKDVGGVYPPVPSGPVHADVARGEP
jgi:hypothetical protein